MFKKQETQLDTKEKRLRIISIVLNLVWALLLLPIIPLSFYSALGTFLLINSEFVAIEILFVIISFLFLITPIIVIISVVSSFFLRKKLKFLWSVGVQLSPVLYFLATYCFFILLFKIDYFFYKLLIL